LAQLGCGSELQRAHQPDTDRPAPNVVGSSKYISLPLSKIYAVLSGTSQIEKVLRKPLKGLGFLPGAFLMQLGCGSELQRASPTRHRPSCPERRRVVEVYQATFIEGIYVVLRGTSQIEKVLRKHLQRIRVPARGLLDTAGLWE
jgi:hypothetical protein